MASSLQADCWTAMASNSVDDKGDDDDDDVMMMTMMWQQLGVGHHFQQCPVHTHS